MTRLSVPPVRRPSATPRRSVFGRRPREKGTHPGRFGGHQCPFERADRKRRPAEARARHRPPERDEAGSLERQVQERHVGEADQRLGTGRRPRGIEACEQPRDAVAAARAEDRRDVGAAKGLLEVPQPLAVGARQVPVLAEGVLSHDDAETDLFEPLLPESEHPASVRRRRRRDEGDGVAGTEARRTDRRNGHGSSLRGHGAGPQPHATTVRTAGGTRCRPRRCRTGR